MSPAELKKAALDLHRQLGGKIETKLKKPLRTKRDLSLLYTPGVGAVSSYLAEHPSKTGDYTMRRNTVAIISDGSAVLGLGNIGPEGALPVMEGKALLFKALAHIDAWPLVLATQDTEEIIKTIQALAPSFGGINLEDISAPRCFEIERRLQETLKTPVFHDDQYGTAMVVLAGLLNAVKVVKKQLKRSRVVISGVGAAGQAIAHLLLEVGVEDITMVDSQGIVDIRRTGLDAHKKELVKKTNKRGVQGTLADALRAADIFIGVSKPGLLTPTLIRTMASRPIVFALANPVPEIMPDLARQAGVAVMATGRSDFPNQINNSLGFPGIFRGALDNQVKRITKTMLIKAAHNLAHLIPEPRAHCIVPDMFDKRVVKVVSRAIRH